MEDYSKEEILAALDQIKQKYPMVYKWFFLFELLKQRDPDEQRVFRSL